MYLKIMTGLEEAFVTFYKLRKPGNQMFEKVVCKECGKTIRRKPIIGTLHLCHDLDEAEIKFFRTMQETTDYYQKELENDLKNSLKGTEDSNEHD